MKHLKENYLSLHCYFHPTRIGASSETILTNRAERLIWHKILSHQSTGFVGLQSQKLQAANSKKLAQMPVSSFTVPYGKMHRLIGIFPCSPQLENPGPSGLP